MGMLLLTKVIAKTIGPLNDIKMACPTPKKIPIPSSIGGSKDFVIG